MPKAYGVNSTIASVDVCQTDKIFYRRTITFLKRCTICFNDCIVGLNWKRSPFFEENNTHLPLNYQNTTTAKPLFQQTASGLFLFILQFLKSLPVLSPVIHNFSFSTYLSYIHFPSFCPLCHQYFFIFHLKKKTVFSICVSTIESLRNKATPSSFHPPNKIQTIPFDHVVLF